MVLVLNFQGCGLSPHPSLKHYNVKEICVIVKLLLWDNTTIRIKTTAEASDDAKRKLITGLEAFKSAEANLALMRHWHERNTYGVTILQNIPCISTSMIKCMTYPCVDYTHFICVSEFEQADQFCCCQTQNLLGADNSVCDSLQTRTWICSCANQDNTGFVLYVKKLGFICNSATNMIGYCLKYLCITVLSRISTCLIESLSPRHLAIFVVSSI